MTALNDEPAEHFFVGRYLIFSEPCKNRDEDIEKEADWYDDKVRVVVQHQSEQCAAVRRFSYAQEGAC